MTIYALPFVNKLSGSYTKQVSFKNNTCKANNQYLRKIGVGLDNHQVNYELKYIGLTEAELLDVETLFSVQLLGDLLSFKAPIDSSIGYYLKPTAWKKYNYFKIVDTTQIRVFDLSFTLELGGGLSIYGVIPPNLPNVPTPPPTYATLTIPVYPRTPLSYGDSYYIVTYDLKLVRINKDTFTITSTTTLAPVGVTQIMGTTTDGTYIYCVDGGTPSKLITLDFLGNVLSVVTITMPQARYITYQGGSLYIFGVYIPVNIENYTTSGTSIASISIPQPDYQLCYGVTMGGYVWALAALTGKVVRCPTNLSSYTIIDVEGSVVNSGNNNIVADDFYVYLASADGSKIYKLNSSGAITTFTMPVTYYVDFVFSYNATYLIVSWYNTTTSTEQIGLCNKTTGVITYLQDILARPLDAVLGVGCVILSSYTGNYVMRIPLP